MINFTLPGGSLFSAPKPPPLQPPAPPLPTPEDPAIQAKADKVATARKRAAGLSQTIQTSGLGDPSDPTVSQPTLGS